MAFDLFSLFGLQSFGTHGLHAVLYTTLTLIIVCLATDRFRNGPTPSKRSGQSNRKSAEEPPPPISNRKAAKLKSTTDGGDDSASDNESPKGGANIADVLDELDQVQHVPFEWRRRTDDEMAKRAEEFYTFMNTRRTLRMFSSEPVPRKIIDNIIRTASTSPSGAHKQPWTYVIISDSEIKSQLRALVEQEEEVNYRRRMGDRWVNALAPFKTNWVKSYIDDAPYIVLVFKRVYEKGIDNTKLVNYYSELSVAISVGILLTAVHNAGLHTLTSTPLNCGSSVSSLLNRPANEKLLFLLPVGFPHKDVTVPDLQRKPLEDIAIYI